ncbi:MAG: polysaccharide deacetylase family protein [Cyclobacteriaceae bacterium]
MIRFYKTPALIRKFYPSLTWRRISQDEIFLTFDDGPHPEITSWVLDELKRHNAKATFFCLGNNLRAHKDVAERLIFEGHLIANHSDNHLKGTGTKDREYVQSLLDCEEEIAQIQKHSKRLFRPPYGRIKKSQIKYINKAYEIIMWSHLSWDFDEKLAVEKSIRILKNASPGSIIVFHDNEKSTQNLKKLLPQLLDHWSSLNLKFSTL